MQTHPALPYRRHIDGLRALAVLMVVFYHAAPQVAMGGFIGVDIFFVISGYLITGIILADLQAGEFSLKGFYAKRCRRILPALFTMLVVIGILGWFVLLPEEFKELGQGLLGGATFTENAFLLHDAGYFDTESIRKPMLHLWSLGIEEQFYIFWPLILLWAYRFKIPLWQVTLALGGLSFALSLHYFHAEPVTWFYILPTRFWELASGAALLAWEAHFANARPLVRNIQSSLALFVVVVFTFLLSIGMFFSQWWPVAACGAAILFISAREESLINRLFLCSAPVVFVGRISYPLYLWHWPLLSLAHLTEGGRPSPGIRLAMVALALLLAWLSYAFLETPLRRRIRLPAQSARVLACSLLAALVIATFGYAIRAGALPPLNTHVIGAEGLDAESLKRAMNHEWWNENHQYIDEACSGSEWPGGFSTGFCRLTDAHPRIALVGDSHANHLIPGLIALNDPVFSHAVEVSFDGCPVEGLQTHLPTALPEDFKRNCGGRNQSYYDKILKDKEISIVIFAQYEFTIPDTGIPLAFNPQDTKAMSIQRTSPEQIREDHEALSAVIGRFEEAGKQVVLMLDIPLFDFDPVSCLTRHPYSITHSLERAPCTVPLEQVRQQRAQARSAIEDMVKRHPGTLVFDPLPAFCDEEYCYAIRDHKLLYRDPDHLSVDGSEFLARELVSHLKKP